MMAKNWIAGAVSKHPGKLTARAKSAGMTLGQYMATPHKDPTIKKEVALARTLKGFNK
jgi:hypothetical protein